MPKVRRRSGAGAGALGKPRGGRSKSGLASVTADGSQRRLSKRVKTRRSEVHSHSTRVIHGWTPDSRRPQICDSLNLRDE